MIELNYEEYKAKVLAQIHAAHHILLATCAEDRVTTRLVCHVLQDTTLLFSTHRDSKKVKQMKENPNVAFSLDGLNIEAEATLCGNPVENKLFWKNYCEKFPDLCVDFGMSADDKAQDHETDMLVSAKIRTIEIYWYENIPGWFRIDFEQKKAYRFE